MPDDHMSEQRLRAIEVAQAEVLTLLRALSIKMDERIKEGGDWFINKVYYPYAAGEDPIIQRLAP